MDQASRHGILGSPVLHLALVAAIGLVAYSNTFSVPFQLDETVFITGNPIVKDLRYFVEPSLARGMEQYGSFVNRYIGYLTFALNYRLHGAEVAGYHAVNLAVHIFNAALLYYLVTLSFRTPFLRASPLAGFSRRIALFAALLFVSHPVQTEAVTYVFQRLASLMAFFYLLSLVAYVRARLSESGRARYALYALSFVSAALAMKTKENAFTLPVVITLYEFLFWDQSPLFDGDGSDGGRAPWWRRAVPLAPLFLIMLVIPLTIIGMEKPIGEIMGGLEPATRGYAQISRSDYLLTQFSVVATYIRLLFLPIDQNFDYDYPLYGSIFTPRVFYSFVFTLLLFGAAVWLIYRSGRKAVELRLAAYGMLWFFITLSVESSLIPLPTIINEYRVYLPSAGALLAAATWAFIVLGKQRAGMARAAMVSCVILLPLVFCYAAYARNSVWESRVTLWKDTAGKSPQSVRAMNNLANAYWDGGFRDRAIANYLAALNINLDNANVHNNLGLAYEKEGLTDKAIEHFSEAVRISPDYSDALYNLGLSYEKKGLTGKAIEHYRAALRARPSSPEVLKALGLACEKKGLMDEAVRCYQTAIMLDSEDADAHCNLGNAYWYKGLADMAIEQYSLALKIRPDFVEAHNNIGFAYNAKGIVEKAMEHFLHALRLRPGFAGTHYNLGLIYLKKGMVEKARGELSEALRIDPGFSDARSVLEGISEASGLRKVAGVESK
jgi:tetratricopeptide (TPR) repeat protein